MKQSNTQVLEDVERLKNILVAAATGQGNDDSEYFRLRHQLVANLLIKDKLPRFVRTCRSLGEFWPYIKEQDGTYAGRRRYLAEQFDPLLTFLEQQANSPGDESVSVILDKCGRPAHRRYMAKGP